MRQLQISSSIIIKALLIFLIGTILLQLVKTNTHLKHNERSYNLNHSSDSYVYPKEKSQTPTPTPSDYSYKSHITLYPTEPSTTPPLEPSSPIEPTPTFSNPQDTQIQIPYDYFDRLFHKGTVVYGRRGNKTDTTTAIVIIDPNDISPNYIWVIDEPTYTMRYDAEGSKLLVLCTPATSEYKPILDFFTRRTQDPSAVGRIFNKLYSEDTLGFNSAKEHSTFFFEYGGKICHPYPLLLTGASEEVTDPRIIAFNNWSSYYDSETLQLRHQAQLLVSSHNHPMVRPYTDYASAEDFVAPFFTQNSAGLVVTAIEGSHIIRVKDPARAKKLPGYDYNKILMEPVQRLRNKVQNTYQDYRYSKEYRINQRNTIFSIPEINSALEDFFVKR